MERVLRVSDLGVAAYSDVLDLQERLFELRVEARIPDTLLLLEHKHVFTLGRNADRENVLEPFDKLRGEGVEVEETGRGGDVTYHGPGQLVGYPIVGIKDAGIGLSEYVSLIEDSIIAVLSGYGLHAGRDGRNRGVWIGNAKIAAIGLRIRKHVSIHGFALNVSPDLTMYSKIIPCGVPDADVTSMQKEGCEAGMSDVKSKVAGELCAMLGCERIENVEKEDIAKT